MPQPTPYKRQANFSSYQAANPTAPLPAASVDAELNAVLRTITQTLQNLKLIQRDDGALANGSVTLDSLAADVLGALPLTSDSASLLVNTFAPLAPYVLDSTSLSAQIRSAFQDPISAKPFLNSSFDGVSTPVDNHDALSTLLPLGRRLEMPQGGIYVGSALAQIVNKPVAWKGGDKATKLVFGAGIGGIDIKQADYTYPCAIEGMEILTVGQEAGTGLKLKMDAIGAPDYTHVYLRRVRVAGYDVFSHGWATGIDMHSIIWPTLADIEVFGRRNFPGGTDVPANYTFMGKGISFTQDVTAGNPDAVGGAGGHWRGIRVNNGGYGIYLYAVGTGSTTGTIEGFNLSQFDLVQVTNGIWIENGNFAGGTVISGGHVNCFEKGILGKHCPQTFLDKVLIFRHPASDVGTTTYGLWFENSSISEFKAQCYNYAPDTNMVGAHLEHVNDSKIVLNAAGQLSKGIEYVNSTYNEAEIIVPENPSGIALFTEDAGSLGLNHTRRPRPTLKAMNSSAFATSSDGAFPVSINLDMIEGETRRVTVAIGHAGGATGGRVIGTVENAGGSATLQFGDGANNFAFFDEIQGSSTSLTRTGSTLVTCTAAGSVIMAALVQAIGSAGNIPVGKAQMTIEAA